MTNEERETCIKTQRKKCTKCKVEKPFKEFTKNSRALLGIASRCRVCKVKTNISHNKKWKENNPKKNSEFSTRYFKKNSRNLTDRYISKLIKTNIKVKISSPIPPELIEVKRQAIRVHRLLYPNYIKPL